MTDLPGRLYHVAKAYLNAAKDRLSEIDAQAQEELSRALTRDDVLGGASGDATFPTANPDPMERARAKIAAMQQRAAAQRENVPSSAETSLASPPVADPVQTAYKVLGLAPGADYPAIQTAVQRLRERCDPSRFPVGSQEQGEAQIILQKVEEAHQVLRVALDPGTGRFDKLEI